MDVCGKDPHPGAAMAHRPHDVRLEAEVHDADERPAVRRRPEFGDRGRRDLPDEVLVLPARDGARRGLRPSRRPPRPGAVTMPRRLPCRAQVPGQRAGVDAGDGRDAVVAQERGQLARVVEDGGRGVGHDEAAQPRARRLVVVAQPAVVADQRVGHDDDLAGVRRVRADLLVAGLARVDDEVAAGRDAAPKAMPGKTVPSSSASSAGPRSPMRGSTIALARGNGGRITRRRPRGSGQKTTHPPLWRGGRGRA